MVTEATSRPPLPPEVQEVLNRVTSEWQAAVYASIDGIKNECNKQFSKANTAIETERDGV